MKKADPGREPLRARFRAQLAESESSDRTFGLTVGVAFLILGILPLIRGGGIRPWAVALGIVLTLLAAVYPVVLRRPKRAWLFFGFLLGVVVNPIVLGVLFFVVITPAGILMRAFGRDSLSLRRVPGPQTYWRMRTEAGSDMRDQF